jgi:hypothetical protein
MNKLAVVPKPEIDSEFALAALRTVVARLKLIESGAKLPISVWP